MATRTNRSRSKFFAKRKKNKLRPEKRLDPKTDSRAEARHLGRRRWSRRKTSGLQTSCMARQMQAETKPRRVQPPLRAGRGRRLWNSLMRSRLHRMLTSSVNVVKNWERLVIKLRIGYRPSENCSRKQNQSGRESNLSR